MHVAFVAVLFGAICCTSCGHLGDEPGELKSEESAVGPEGEYFDTLDAAPVSTGNTAALGAVDGAAGTNGGTYTDSAGPPPSGADAATGGGTDSGTGGGADAATGGGADAAAADSSGNDDASPPQSVSILYVATVAGCVNPDTPDPDFCEIDTGAGQLSVDLEDSDTLKPFHAYLRFDTDAALEGKTVLSVTLRMTASDDEKASGPNSGEIWEVSAFARSDLFSLAPPVVSAAPLGADQGAVLAGALVQWQLPETLVTANAGVFLSIRPLSTDGVNYWNLSGTTPPELLVEYE